MDTAEPDIRRHPNLNAKRLMLGMDYNAGTLVVAGAVLFLILAGWGLVSRQLVVGIGGGSATLGASYWFARKFLHNRPSSYFMDWLESKRSPDYRPWKFRTGGKQPNHPR